MNNFNMQGPGAPGRAPASFNAQPSNTQLQHIVHTKLQEQGPHQGWQTQVDRTVRVGNIVTLFTQMRLAGANTGASVMERLGQAMTMERQIFQASLNADHYANTIGERNKSLHVVRQNIQNQSNVAQTNPMMRNATGMNRNGPGAQVPTQMGLPNNMPGMMGNTGMQQNNSNANMFMRQPSQTGPPNQPGQPPPQPPMPQPNQTSAPSTQPHLHPNFNPMVAQLRNQLEQTGNAPQMRDQLRQRISAPVQQALLSRGVDLLQYYAESIVKQRLAGKPGPPAATQGANAPPINPGQNQSGMPPGMRTQASDANKPSIDFAQVLGQQAAAERSQASGDLVVPASNNQNFQGQLGRVFPPQAFGSMSNGNNNNAANNHTAGMSGQMQGNLPNSRPPSSFQGAQMPGAGLHQPGPNFNNANSSPAQNQFLPGQPNALTGQPGGLHMPGPSPAMPTLNKPMGAGGQQTPQRPNQNIPQSQKPSPRPGAPIVQTPNPAQAAAAGQLPNLMGPQGREWISNQMNRLPVEQRGHFMQFIRSQVGQQNYQAQQARPVPAPVAGGNNRFGVTPQNQMAMQGSGPGSQSMQPNAGLNAPQAPMNAAPSVPNFQPQGRGHPMANPNNHRLEQMMNAMPLPKDAINKGVPELDIPMGIVNWAGLFDFLSKTPNALSTESQKNLKTIRHRQMQMHLNAQRNRQPSMGAPGNPNLGNFTNNAPFVNAPQDKPQQMQELIRGNILEANNMRQARLKDVSPQELQIFRQRNSQGENARGRESDMQVRNLIMRSKAEKVVEQMGNQEFAKALLITFSHSNTAQPQLPAPGAQNQAPTQGSFDQGMMSNVGNQQAQPGPALMMANQQRPPAATIMNGTPRPGPPGNANQMYNNKDNLVRAQEDAKKRALQAHQAQNKAPNNAQNNVQNSSQNSNNIQVPEFKGDWATTTPDDKTQRFVMLTREANSNAARIKPVTLPPSAQNESIIKAVRSAAENLQVMITALRAFYHSRREENYTREVLAAICFVRKQIKAGTGQNNIPLQIEINAPLVAVRDNLTTLNKFWKTAQEYQTKRAGGAPASEQASGRASTQPAVQATQQKATARPPSQTSNKAGGPPAKPQQAANKATSVHGPPGRPLPDGSVQYFNENQASQFNLAIPPNKLKQRASQPPTGPAPTPPMVKQEQAQKPAPASIQPPPPLKLEQAFKCSVPGCEFETIGFTSQQLQQDHERSAHKYAGDPLRWCLGSLKEALGLNKPAVVRQAAAARAQAALRPVNSQSVAMKREASAQSSMSQGRPGSVLPGQGSRPSSAAGNKRSANSVEGHNEVNTGSPSKRPRTTPPRIDIWQHTDWSPELLDSVFGTIPEATVLDPLAGCAIPGFESFDITPDEVLDKQDDGKVDEGEDQVMKDVDHVQDLIDWQDAHTEALFKDMSHGISDSTEQLSGDWFMVDGSFTNPEPSMEITDEQIEEFLKGESTADLEQAFVEVDT